MSGLRPLLGAGAGAILVLLAGHGLLRLAAGRRPHRAYGLPAAVGLSWFAGVAVLGTLTTLVAVLGLTTRPLPVLAPVLAALAAAGAVPPRRAPDDAAPAERSTRVGDLVAAATAVLATARIAVLSAGIPVSSNDEYALWMLRGRVLSQLGGLDPRVFAETASGYQHQTYPLFLPASFAWFDSWAGRPSDAAAHLVVALTVGALLAVTGAVVTRLAGPAAAAVALLLVLSLPTLLAGQSLRLMADVPVFAFAFCAALVLLLLVAPARGGWRARPVLAAAAVLGAGAIGTKAEGLAFTGVAFGAALLLAASRRRGVLLAGVTALAANLPWQAYVRRHGLRNWVLNGDTLDPAHLRDVLPWTGHVLRGMAERWPGGSWSGVLAAAAAAAAVLAVRAGSGRVVLFVAAVLLADVAILAGQYVITAYGPPADPLAGPLLEDQLDVTVSRVTLLPAALLAVAVPVLSGLALRTGRAAAGEPGHPQPAPVQPEPGRVLAPGDRLGPADGTG